MDNYYSVLQQMQAFGVEFIDTKDLPLKIDLPKRKGCGKKGKWWYWLRSFYPASGGCVIVGRFGSYKSGESQKVMVDWRPLTDADRTRMAAERAEAARRAEAVRQAEAELAAMGAADLWRIASPHGHSKYLDKKGVVGEACRYLPNGDLLVPLLRYDMPRDQALRAIQRIRPDGYKLYTEGFIKNGCAVRLGVVDDSSVVLVCEGYATGLTLRMATAQALAVYVALDAGNLQHVVPLVRALHPTSRILICADDDYLTTNWQGILDNVGRRKARAIAKDTARTDILYPVFNAATRGLKDTDFNDLHMRQGLSTVSRQLQAVLQAMRHKYG